MEAVLADGAKQQPGEAATTATADDKKPVAAGPANQCLDGRLIH